MISFSQVNEIATYWYEKAGWVWPPKHPSNQGTKEPMNNEANDFLFAGGAKAAKLENIGDAVEGTITDAEVRQQTDMDSGTPLTWPDGNPKMQLVITLQTDTKDDPDDDGLRRLFAKGGKYEAEQGTGTSMKDAVADAVRKAGGKELLIGAKLKVGHTGLGKKTNRGYSAPKLYRATYEAPVKSVAAADLWDEN